MAGGHEQRRLLEHALSLLYFWCRNESLEHVPSRNNFPGDIIETSKCLCSVDIFAPDYRLPDAPDGRLVSLFSKICLPPKCQNKSKETSYPAATLGPETIPFPGSPPVEDWKPGAAEEIRQNYGENVNVLLVLLEKYGSYIPVTADSNYNDISLYEHIKFLCSLAVKGDGDRPYLLVSADLSGIQDYIYTISSKGALKTLRAHSFLLEVLLQHTIYEILRASQGSAANVVYSGGGGFVLLLPAADSLAKFLPALKDLINKWLWQEMSGRLYLGMQWMEVGTKELMAAGFPQAWPRMGQQMERDKQHKFMELIPGVLGLEDTSAQAMGECDTCHRDIKEDLLEMLDEGKDEERRLCPTCRVLFEWGDRLTSYESLVRRSSRSAQNTFPLRLPSPGGNVYYELAARDDSAGDIQAKWVKNSWRVEKYLDGNTFLLLHADHVTKVGGSTADFEFLSRKSYGKKMVGALRMDVDNLGLILTQGMIDVPHYSALSRQIGIFFSIYMNILCKGECDIPLDIMSKRSAGQNKERNVSIIYSGGDDLFVVGAWDETIELANDIALNFKKFTAFNPDVSISGGFITVDDRFPLYQTANLCHTALEEAKGTVSHCKGRPCSLSSGECSLHIGDKCRRKNTGLLFYNAARSAEVARINEVNYRKANTSQGEDDSSNDALPAVAYRWEEIGNNVVPVVRMFRLLGKSGVQERIELRGLSRGFMRRLFSLVDMWEKEGVLYYPMMHYVVAKMKTALQDAASDPSKEGIIKEFLGPSGEGARLLNRHTIKYLRTALIWVDFLMREELENDAAENESPE